MTSEQNRQAAGPSERSAVVDLAAVQHNVGRLLDLARGRTLIAVVKADAYGHGAPQVARAALAAGAHMLGTAHVAEALALRAQGITAPVLAWLHTAATDFNAAVSQDVRLGLSGGELDLVLDAAREAGRPAVVHLKFDSGLGRNGATPAQWPRLLERVRRAESEGLLTVEGVFTHLAVADEPTRPETAEQLAAFQDAVRAAREAGLNPTLVHAANTPGLLSAADLPDPDAMLLDAVRVGLGLYGLSPFADRTPQEFGLVPAMTLRTRVANVKDVPAGAGVSYGLTYRTEGPTRLVLVPLGYADGVPRVATGAPVRIGDRIFPVVGRIAMDQCVVDLSLGRPVGAGAGDGRALESAPPTAGRDGAGPEADDAVPHPGDLPGASPFADRSGEPSVRIGDEAVLFGAGTDPSVVEWADAAGTINYEIVTRISPRVPREYVAAEPRSDIDRGRHAQRSGHRGVEPVADSTVNSAGDPSAHPGVDHYRGTDPVADGVADGDCGPGTGPGGVVPRQDAQDGPGEGAAAGENWSLTRELGTAEETRELARALAPHLRAGDLVLLNGELGAGKTTFTQGLGEGLGVREGIISPTFVLARRHPNLADGPLPGGPDLVHVDAYRLTTAEDVESIDLEDTLDTCVTVVEWGTGKVEHLSGSRLVVDIERARGAEALPEQPDTDLAGVLADLGAQWQEEGAADETRRVTLRGIGPRWARCPRL
ncbi:MULTISPECIES: alanine racemase [Kocuria]|uniref:alanine racemase n=2 Tax=Micrococcaceae TaxID=1268 RepID=UPI002882EC78|nr:alanine racemase [Kocuria rhizophila]